MRTPIIAGNWKMNNTIDESLKLVKELIPKVKDSKCEIVVCPTFVCLESIIRECSKTNIKVGAQNLYFEEKGAFTGEVSPGMLESMGVEYVILGHSERRQHFNETDIIINKKLKAAFKHNLKPILCVGESLEEREANVTREIIVRQIKLGLKGLTENEVQKAVIAYEPIWAIGTGKTATDEQANDVIKHIRSIISDLYSDEVANKIRIQYGGSVKPATIKGQMSQSDIDGALVGGASLKADDFAAIVNY